MKSGGPRSPMMDDGGESGGWPDGRYVMSGAAAGQVAVVSDPLANLEPKADSWLNKDFFKIERPRSIAVTFPNATNSWKLTRETESGELKLADAKPDEVLDTSKASGVGNPFSSPSISDVAAGVKPEEAGLDKATVIAVETFDGFTYTVKVGAKTNENYFLTLSLVANFPKERTPGKDEKPEDKAKLDKEFADKQKKLEEKLAQEKTYEPWTYLVQGWSVDSLLKERAQLFVEKKDETKKDPAPTDPPAADDKPEEEKQ